MNKKLSTFGPIITASARLMLSVKMVRLLPGK
jgi:hypothetical protein